MISQSQNTTRIAGQTPHQAVINTTDMSGTEFENEGDHADRCVNSRSVSLASLVEVRRKRSAGTVMVRGDSEFVYDGDREVGKVSLLVLRRRPCGRVTYM